MIPQTCFTEADALFIQGSAELLHLSDPAKQDAAKRPNESHAHQVRDLLGNMHRQHLVSFEHAEKMRTEAHLLRTQVRETAARVDETLMRVLESRDVGATQCAVFRQQRELAAAKASVSVGKFAPSAAACKIRAQPVVCLNRNEHARTS
jgi:hypothetical protein